MCAQCSATSAPLLHCFCTGGVTLGSVLLALTASVHFVVTLCVALSELEPQAQSLSQALGGGTVACRKEFNNTVTQGLWLVFFVTYPG